MKEKQGPEDTKGLETQQQAPETQQRAPETQQRAPEVQQRAPETQAAEVKTKEQQVRSHTLRVSCLNEAVLRWVQLAIGLGRRERGVLPGAPPASFDAMLFAAHFLDDADAQWLAGQLVPTAIEAYDARFDAARVRGPALLADAPADVLPQISGGIEAWLEEAERLAFGHRPDAKVRPAEVVAAFLGRAQSGSDKVWIQNLARDPGGQSGYEAEYARLPVQRERMAEAFVEHVRAAHPELGFTFESMVGGRERITVDELRPLVEGLAAEAFQCFEEARAAAGEPRRVPGELLARLARRLELASLVRSGAVPGEARGTAVQAGGGADAAKAEEVATTTTTAALGEVPLEVGAWLESARVLAVAAGSARIDTHHLVAVALRRGRAGGDPLLSEAVNQAEIGAVTGQLLERVGATRGDEAPVIWDYFEARAPVPPVAPAYRSDLADGTDRLNFEADAKAVALLAAAPGVPPLSIGVFGDWGTGKSFFMRRVRKYATADDVLQIEFNAWNYAEGNLFASIAHRVFTALREQMGAPGTNPLDDALPAALRSETARTAVQVAGAKRAQLEAQVEKRRRVVDPRRPSGKALVEAGLDTIATPAVEPGKEDAAAKEKVEQAKAKLRAEVAAGWKLAREKVLRWRVIAPLLLGTAAVVALIVALPVLPTLKEWRVHVGTIVAAALSSVVVVGKYVKTGLSYVGKAKASITTLDGALRESKRRNDPKLRGLTHELSEAIVAETDAKSRSAVADQELKKHLDRVKGSAPMERLDALVRDRFESGTYRKMLGVVEQVRSDLETLSVLLVPDHDAKRRSELLAKHGIEASMLPPLRRIILYVDDLDRCPSDKVVEVLQAVHLLLAYPLFVVLVAVDPRWGIASLERSFEQLTPTGGHAITSATGFDYLEKIFQIPLWVRAMSGGDAARLLGDYLPIGPISRDAGAAGSAAAGSRPVAAGAAGPRGAGGATGAAAAGDARAGSAADAGHASATSAATGASAERANPSDLDRAAVSIEEFNYAEWLAASLGSSPRRVKRFANLYRLVKAMLSGPEWHDFDLEDARACLTLLAIQTGAPSVAPEVLHDLITGARAENATELLGLPALLAPRSPRLDPADAERAKEIVRIYAGKTPRDPRRRLQQWAPRICRLSFRRDAVRGPAAAITAQVP